MKNILVLAHDDVGQEARIQAALDLARALDGHVTCLDVAMMLPPMTEFDAISVSAQAFGDELTREKANRARIEARLANEDVRWDWIDASGDIATELRRVAPLSDLIVVNRAIDDIATGDALAIASELIVKSDRPVFAVPAESIGVDPRGSAFVCWDGSPASEAALRAATPLLKLASNVTLVEVEDGSIRTPAAQAAMYLSRHDIAVTIEREQPADRKTGAVLLSKLRAERPAYAVMGGYGHSRMVQALFGGVTKSLLSESPVPLLLAR